MLNDGLARHNAAGLQMAGAGLLGQARTACNWREAATVRLYGRFFEDWHCIRTSALSAQRVIDIQFVAEAA